MLGFIRKAFIQYRKVDLQASCVGYMNIRTIQSLKSTEQQSLTVSYLTDSCGLSLDKAISVSRLVHIENTGKPDSILRLLQSFGFAKPNIAFLISKYPRVLMAFPEETLRSKIEFFHSLGVRGKSLIRIISSNKYVIWSSLEKQIIPTIDFLKGIVGTNERVVCILRNSTRLLGSGFEKRMVPNISTLRMQGVPEGHIQRLIVLQASSLSLRVDLFEEMVNEVKAMGFEPKKMSFIQALRTKTIMSKATWERKKDLLMSYGWSAKEFQSAFTVQPSFMLTSEKKIKKVMDFLLNTAGLKPSDVACYPYLFFVSFEGRMIPRWLLLEALMSRGLIKHVDLERAFVMNNNVFEKRYLIEFEEDALEIIKAYRQGTRFKDLVADFMA